jgi:glutathione S-transferase
VGLIYHIATRADWERALSGGSGGSGRPGRPDGSGGEYATSTIGRTLAEEGFIHASSASQVTGVANRYYRHVQGDLLLLAIDPERVRAEVRWDEVPGSPLPFPHIYGPLNVDAVVSARPIAPGPDGTYQISVAD